MPHAIDPGVTMFPTALLAAATLLAAPPPGSSTAPDLRPDIVLILADDLGHSDLGCFGGEIAETPNLDRMAREGVRFTRYYAASPICSPSRCGLLTGQYPGRWRITSFLQTRKGNRACGQADFLDPAAPSLPRALAAAGYATAHVGKWHLGGGRDVVAPPKFAAYGYDLGFGTWESSEPHPDLTAKDWIWSAEDPVKRWDRTRWMADRALDFLKGHPERPCFVNLWLDDPHTPWVPSAEDQEIGEDGRATGKGPTRARLRGVLAEVDRQVGRVLRALRERDSGRPVVVLFLSDNGPLPTFMAERSGGLRGSKLSLYEGGIRVPLIAWGPGIVPAGVTDDTTVLSGLDLPPTLCGIAGAAPPAGAPLDGRDMGAALRGKPVRRTGPLFWEYGRNDESFAYSKGRDRSPNLAVRDGDWKYLTDAGGGGGELYDLGRDPREAHDLSAEEPEVAARLAEAVRSWRKSLP